MGTTGPTPVEVLHAAIVPSTIGLVLAATGTRGLRAVLIGDDGDALVAELARRLPAASIERVGAGPAMRHARLVAACIDAPGTASCEGVELDLRGTPLQVATWRALRAIPLGGTVPYGEIARRVGRPAAVRAVAQSCARNLLAIVVPCHRVVGRDGTLTGYRWGIERKRMLLEREGHAAAAIAQDRRRRSGTSRP